MIRIQKKIISFLLLASLLSLSLNFLYNNRRVSAQFEEMAITCEKEIPSGEAIDQVEGWAQEIREDLDAALMAFTLQEHAAQRLVKLTQSDGTFLVGSIAQILQVENSLKLEDLIAATLKISKAIEKIDFHDSDDNVKSGRKGLEKLKEAYDKLEAEKGANFDSIFKDITGAIDDIRSGLDDITTGVGDLTLGISGINKIKNGLTNLPTGLLLILSGLNDLDIAIGREDQVTGLYKIKGECTQWICEQWNQDNIFPAYYDELYPERGCSQNCVGTDRICPCYEGTSGLTKIEAATSRLIEAVKKITDVLDLLIEVKEAFLNIKAGIEGTYELYTGLLELDTALKGVDISELQDAITAAIEVKERAEPLVQGAIEVMDATKLPEIVDASIAALDYIPEGTTEIFYTISDIVESIRDVVQEINDITPSSEEIKAPLYYIWDQVASFTGSVLESIKSKIKDMLGLEQDEEIDGSGTESDLTTLENGLTDTIETIIDEGEDALLNEIEENVNILDDLFSLLEEDSLVGEENMDIYNLEEYFAQIQIMGLTGAEFLLDLTGLNNCSCHELKCYTTYIPSPWGEPIPFCLGWACPYFQIEMSWQTISNIYSWPQDWFGKLWGGITNFWYWATGHEGMEMPKLLLGVEGLAEHLQGLIETEYDWITPQRDLRLWSPFEGYTWIDYDWLSWRTWQKWDWDSLTIPEGILLTTEVAGNELGECFTVAEMIEMDEPLKWLVKCDVALDEGVVATIIEPDLESEDWQKTPEGKCYFYPNNYFCCQ